MKMINGEKTVKQFHKYLNYFKNYKLIIHCQSQQKENLHMLPDP